jgi:hypothetical protein
LSPLRLGLVKANSFPPREIYGSLDLFIANILYQSKITDFFFVVSSNPLYAIDISVVFDKPASFKGSEE